MDFTFTEEQEAFRRVVADYARTKAETYLERAAGERLDPELTRELAQIGVTTLLISAEAGGGGGDAVSVGIAAEELGRHDPALGLAAMIGLVTPLVIERHASAAVRERVLARVVAGETLVAMAMTEPQGGSDLRAHTTRARRTAGGWRVDGVKTSVTLATHADYAVVLARVDGPAGGSVDRRADPFSAFLVELDRPGVSRQRFHDHGARFWGRGELSFDGVLIPDENLIGPPGEALRIVLAGLDFNRAVIGLACVGAARQALVEAGAHAADRVCFGGSLLTKQGVAFPLAEHATRLEAARWLCYRALWLRDAGLPQVKEAAMAKWWAPLVAREALHDCLLVFGHTGYSTEHPVGQRLLDVMGCEIGDGTAQIQKLVIARELFGAEHQAR